LAHNETLLCVWREEENNPAVIAYAHAVHRAYQEGAENGELQDGMEPL
jgi:hypothetical protein